MSFFSWLLGVDNLREDIRDREAREEFRKNSCGKGNHFVGNSMTSTAVWCEVCGIHAILKDKKDSTKGYRWPKL